MNQQYQQPNRQAPVEQQNYSQPYEQPQRQRRQKPPKVGLDTRVEYMDPKKRKLFLNLFKMGIMLVILYAVLSFFLIHMFDASNGFAFRGDYLGYVNSDFLIAAIPLIFLGFGWKILKGSKLNIPQQMLQQQQGQPQQPIQTQQPRQQTQFKIPENPYRQQQSYKPPENIFAQKDTHWNVPPNYLGENQSHQGSWKCPNCGFLELDTTCRKCGYKKRM